MPSASPLRSGGTSSDTCHSSAAFCIIEPENETSSPIQISRKLRCCSATNDWNHVCDRQKFEAGKFQSEVAELNPR